MSTDLQKNEISPASIAGEYARGKAHKEGIGQYEKVKLCERFFEGDQWHGVKTRVVQPVTMNFLRRVVSYFQAMIVSDDIGFEVRPFLGDGQTDEMTAALESAVDRVIERQKLKTLGRESLRDAAVDGDSVLYFWFDPDQRTGAGGVQGDIRAELLMNTNIIFGNPYSAEVQEQPYLLLVRRLSVGQVRDKAKRDGVTDWDSIRPDTESEYKGEDEASGDALCTEVTRFWKRDGVVWFCKAVGDVLTAKPIGTGMTLYPVAYWSWLKKKNSCHGVRPLDEVLPTQIAVNRIWTAINIHIQSIAFPKIVYNRQKFPKGWDATPGVAVGVQGDVREAATGLAGGVSLPTQIVEVLTLMIDATRDFMGASDAALGNVRPENTSAIIAVQKATSAPLELQRLAFYQFTEDWIRILVDMMHAYYGLREVKTKADDTGEAQIVTLDFGAIDTAAMDLNVEVGAASYWSELTQITNLNNLFSAGIMTDAVDFLERVPKGLIPDLSGLIAGMKERQQMEQMQMMQMQQMPPQGEQPML